MRVLIFGAGYSGQAFAKEIAPFAKRVAGTTRSEANFGALGAAGATGLVFDGRQVSAELAQEIRRATHVVVSAAPDESGDPTLNAAGSRLAAAPDLAWVGYLSTVGVYGDAAGGWVTEETAPAPVSQRARERVAAEQAWEAFGRSKDVPAAILRLSGIYGPGRNAFVNLANGTARRIVKPGQVFNRVHVDDIAGALTHLARLRLGGIFNVTDDEPAPPQDVIAYAAGIMNVEAPPEIAFEAADLSAMAKSFYADCKRVSNDRLKRTGYVFRQPDYRTGLDRLHRAGTWRAGAPRSRINST